jgi:tetratricopeptide (TPR) repeat protein
MGRIGRFDPRLTTALATALLAPAVALSAPDVPAPRSADTLSANPDVVEMIETVEANPSEPRLYGDLGNLYAAKGWDDLAIAAYRQAIKLDDGLYSVWANLGTVYTKTEEFDQAESAFQRAIQIRPRAALAHYNLGVVLDRSGRYEEALQSYKTAVTYDPGLLDPAVNPQVVNNAHVTAIQLMTYLDEVGSATLPLEEMPAALVTVADETVADETAADETVADETVADETEGAPARKPVLGTLILREEPRPDSEQ